MAYGFKKNMAYSIKNMAYGKNEMEHKVIVRLHRAPHDFSQNEAESTNAAIGRPVEPPADPFWLCSRAMRFQSIPTFDPCSPQSLQ